MTWRDDLVPASFRGATFHVETTEVEVGRRQIDHEYPGKDSGWTEDNGRNKDTFTIDGYLVGLEYKDARDLLVAACRDVPGPGVLIHPDYGEIQVNCKGLRLRNTNKEGGFVKLSMTFKESGNQSFPNDRSDSVSSTNIQRESLIDSSKLSFIEKYVTAGMPGHVIASATDLIEGVTDQLKDNPLVTELEAASDFSNQVRGLAAAAEDLARAPDQLADRIASVLDAGRAAFRRASDSLLALFDDNSDDESILPSDTPIRRQERINNNAINQLVREISLAEVSQSGVEQVYESTQDAESSSNAITDRIDQESETVQDDDVYSAMINIRAEVVNGIPQDGETLPFVIEFTPMATLPSLVIAQRLYGDANRDLEIVARNGIDHPGFVPGGEALEVLSDG